MVTLVFAWAKVKIMYFLETFEGICLRFGLSSEINKIMKLNEYQISKSKFALVQRSSDLKFKLDFSWKQSSHLEPNFTWTLLGEWDLHFYK